MTALTVSNNSSSAAVTITQTGAGNALVVEDETSPDATAFTIDSTGNVGIGTAPIASVPLVIYNATQSNLHLYGDGAVGMLMQRSSGDATQSSYIFRKSRGTRAVPSAVNSSDYLGSIGFQGYGGTTWRGLAQISAHVTTYTSDTDISTNLRAFTTPSGSVTPVENLRIASDGTTSLGGTNTAPAFLIIPAASQVNWIAVSGRGTGAAPYFLAQGETDVSMSLVSKGTGNIEFTTNGSLTNRQVRILGTEISANRHITLTGSNGGNPTIGTSAGTLNLNAGLVQPIVTNTAGTLTITDSHYQIIQTTAASVYTLPTASSYTGRVLKIVTQFAGTVTSNASNVVPIAGGAAGTAILAATAGKFAILQSNGTNWVIVAAN
jgi:hypothetical protein